MKLIEALYRTEDAEYWVAHSPSRNRTLRIDEMGAPIDVDACCVAKIDLQDWLANDWEVQFDETV